MAGVALGLGLGCARSGTAVGPVVAPGPQGVPQVGQVAATAAGGSLQGGELPVVALAEIGFLVSDLKAAQAFYGDFLGFRQVGFSPMRRLVFEVAPGQTIEVIRGDPDIDGRLDHVSFHVRDARQIEAALVAAGHNGTLLVVDGGRTAVGLRDPDGHRIQFIESEAARTVLSSRRNVPDPGGIATHMAHFGFLVGRLDRALDFYQRTLGFVEFWRGSSGGSHLDWVNLQIPGGPDYVELMLYEELPPPDERGTKNHVCLFTPDVERAVAVLAERPNRGSYWREIAVKVGRNRKRQVNLYDHDGNRIELMEPDTVDGVPAPSSKAPPPRLPL